MEKINEGLLPIEIYTDGSSKSIGSTRFGGWAFIAIQDCKEIYYAADGEHGATNQRMELMAVLRALEYAQSIRRPHERVIIYSDSAYVINCYKQQWYIDWKANGWRNAAKKDVANKELWYEIIPFFDDFWYNFYKVEGHSGIMYNEKCDKLAQDEADKLKIKWRG